MNTAIPTEYVRKVFSALESLVRNLAFTKHMEMSAVIQ
jgi:hypothetical protein